MIIIYETGLHLYHERDYPEDLCAALDPVSFLEFLMTVLPMEVATLLTMEDLDLEYDAAVAVVKESSLYGSVFNSSMADN